MPASNENRSVISPAMDDTPADAARLSRCSILLVHGTWGRGIFPKMSDLRRGYFRGTKRWFEEGSQFCERLDAALKSASLDWPIRAFLWSGANSVYARDRAARDLSKQLREGLKDPDATAVIIAHSHGGNVALRALQHLDFKTDRIRVVTLATPFLRVFARRSLQLSYPVKLFMLAAIVITLFASLLVLDSIVSETVGLELLLAVRKIANNDDLVFQIIVALSAVAGFYIMEWLNEVFTNPHAALAIEELAHYDTKGAAASRMLVIRGVDDEASLSLAAGSIGSRLSFLTLVAVIPAIYAVVVVFLLLVSFFGLQSSVSKLGLWIGGLIIGVFFGALILFFVPGAFKSFFGREFLINGMTCDIAVDSGPDTLGQVEAITLRPIEAASSKPRSLELPFSLRWMLEISLLEFRGMYFQMLHSRMWHARSKPSWQLRHGIYNHPNCVDEIVRWLRRVT
jgi:hypothetical protein